MSRLIGYFEDETALIAAAAEAREAGLSVEDAYTPYAVHGLDEAMGVRRSRLPWVCFLVGLTGGALGFAFEMWTSAVSWRLNIGGKPFASVPAFIPVTFELTVLSAALGSAFAFFGRSRLFPGRRAVAPPRVTDDRFALLLAGDAQQARHLLQGQGAVEIAEADGVAA